MEMTCSRCHQVVPADSCFCSACGLPQLVYSVDGDSAPAAAERWPETARDASSIDWKPGMRAAVALAVPAGLLSSGISPLSWLGVFWVTGAAAWAVVLYMRSQRPAWITMGAGARIGLVTGLIAGWLAFGVSGTGLFVKRVALRQGNQMDAEWREIVETTEQKVQQVALQAGASADVAQVEVKGQRNLMLSPEGHAGFATTSLFIFSLFMVLFATVGGALGARTMGKRSRPEN